LFNFTALEEGAATHDDRPSKRNRRSYVQTHVENVGTNIV